MSQRTQYKGEGLTQALLLRRREEVQSRHRRAVGKVDEMLSTQRSLGNDLTKGLTTLKGHGSELESLKASEESTGLLASLVRPFTARRNSLARRSIAEGLLHQYETVTVRLAEATSFTDELKLTSLEMQQEVDRLHRELGEALHNQRVAAGRVLAAEAALKELETLDDLSKEARERRRDRYTFDLRTETIALELYEAAGEQCRAHIDPARALRDTVLELHEDMAKYVLSATHTVNAAGRRIQGIGMLADAPMVVAELQESLDELNTAMQATSDYVEQSQKLIAEVLPELTAKVQAENEASHAVLHSELEQVDREKARIAAERALRQTAEEEIDALLGDL